MAKLRLYNLLLVFLGTLCVFLLIRRLLAKPLSLLVPGSSAIHFSIRTTASYHKSRLSLLLRTWLNTIEPKQVHIATDMLDTWTSTAQDSGYQIILTACDPSHHGEALCCKSGFECEHYYRHNQTGGISWYCHFDDDMYVNVGALVRTLARYSPDRDRLYLGQRSTNGDSKFDVHNDVMKKFSKLKSSSYHFGTGAAYCISSSLMMELEPYLRGPERFVNSCRAFRQPDDLTIGAVIGAVLGYELTLVPGINTHYSFLSSLTPISLVEQVTISYGQIEMVGHPALKNVVEIPNAQFSEEDDPTRFLSYHCLLYPDVPWCARNLYHCLRYPKTSWCH